MACNPTSGGGMAKTCLAVLLVLGPVALGSAEARNPLDKKIEEAGRKAVARLGADKTFRYDGPSGRGSIQLVEPQNKLALEVTGTQLADDTLTGTVTVSGPVKVTGNL